MSFEWNLDDFEEFYQIDQLQRERAGHPLVSYQDQLRVQQEAPEVIALEAGEKVQELQVRRFDRHNVFRDPRLMRRRKLNCPQPSPCRQSKAF